MKASATRMLALALLTLGAPGDAPAQGTSGLFSITPARRDVVGRPVERLSPTEVANTTRQDLQVLVFPVLLGQDVSGQFTFSETPADLLTAAKIVGAAPSRFDMPAGSRRTVRLTWALLPAGQRTAFVGVVFQSRAKPRPGQVVRTVQRLLSVNFLRLPGRYASSGRFTRVRAIQAAPRVIQVIPRLRNTGEVVAAPRAGVLRIRDASGAVVVRQRWSGDVILPGYQREFPIQLRKVLPAGRYAARVVAAFGRSRKLTIATGFTLVGPNQLPTPRVEITGFSASGTIGGDSRAGGVVRSVGSAPADTAVRVDLFRKLPTGQIPARPQQSRRLTFARLAPGRSRDLKVVYPGLAAGAYRVIATYRQSPGSVQRVQADFSPVAEESFTDKLRRFWRDHKGLVLSGLALLALLVLLLALLRRQRRLEERLRAAESAAGIPAVPAGAADVNRASVAELRQVPGVSPATAAAIVAHREAHGPFASVDDLAAVPGVGAEGVERLRPYLRA